VYVDEDGKDVGANVRQKAKDITNLLADEDRLRAERRSRGAMRDRMLGNLADSGLRGDRDFGDRSEGARYVDPPNISSSCNLSSHG
jgi:epsin